MKCSHPEIPSAKLDIYWKTLCNTYTVKGVELLNSKIFNVAHTKNSGFGIHLCIQHLNELRG
jgi:hypothetical protein